jgi:hypothetical protein
MAHLFRKAIPTVAMNAVQNLALIARCPLWEHTWEICFLRQLHRICDYPLDYPTFPLLVVTPFELPYPVFQDDVWKHILAYSEQSLASQIWHSCPPLQESFPLAQATEEERTQLLAACAHGLPGMQTLDFSSTNTMSWQQSYPMIRALFSDWQAHAPEGMDPSYALFPIQLSCVISRLIFPSDLPFHTPADCLMTGSQFIFYWDKAVDALDRLMSAEARAQLLSPAFQGIGRRSTYPIHGRCSPHLDSPHVWRLYGFSATIFCNPFR